MKLFHKIVLGLLLVVYFFPLISLGATANTSGNITLSNTEVSSKWTYGNKSNGQEQLFQFVYTKNADGTFNLKQVFEGRNGSGNNVVNWVDSTSKYQNTISAWSAVENSGAISKTDTDTMQQVGGNKDLQRIIVGEYFGIVKDDSMNSRSDLATAVGATGQNVLSANNNELLNSLDGGRYRPGTTDSTDTVAEQSKQLSDTFGLTPTYTNQSAQGITYATDDTPNICDTNGVCKYKMLAPISGILGNSSGYYEITRDTKSLCTLLNSWFRIGIGLAGLLAVVMIVWGGFQYATTDALETAKTEGKSKISNALWGLLLALTTYLILNTINPDLTNCELKASAVTLTQSIANSVTDAANGVLGVANQAANAANSLTWDDWTDEDQAKFDAGDTAAIAKANLITNNEAARNGSGERVDGVSDNGWAIAAAAWSVIGTCQITGGVNKSVGCANSVDNILKNSGYAIGAGDSTIGTNATLSRSSDWVKVEGGLANALPGDVVVSPTTEDRSKIGHTGIVATAGATKIISNSSNSGTMEANYSAASWTQRYSTNKGLPINVYRHK